MDAAAVLDALKPMASSLMVVLPFEFGREPSFSPFVPEFALRGERRAGEASGAWLTERRTKFDRLDESLVKISTPFDIWPVIVLILSEVEERPVGIVTGVAENPDEVGADPPSWAAGRG